jgi:hypothetical protein
VQEKLKYTSIKVFMATLFIVVKKWEYPDVHYVMSRETKFWCVGQNSIHMIEYSSTIKEMKC